MKRAGPLASSASELKGAQNGNVTMVVNGKLIMGLSTRNGGWEEARENIML